MHGYLSVEQVLMTPELSSTSLALRLLDVCRDDHDMSKWGKGPQKKLGVADAARSHSRVSFDEFVHLLALFSPNMDRGVAKQYLFRAFDIDGDGFVSVADLFATLATMLRTQCPTSQLRHLAASIVRQFDEEKRGKLDPEEMSKVFDHTDILANFGFEL